MVEIEIDQTIMNRLNCHAPVAIGVSGGKDSSACAEATVRFLREKGYDNEIILVHADLGRIEWADSARICQELAEHLGLELVVVRREKGDMVDRWLQRWRDNFARYSSLDLVTMVLPWSTPQWRFCTSELKTQIIGRYLKRRFGGNVINVTGVRRAESAGRSKTPTSKALPAVTFGTWSYTWNPIAAWSVEDVWACIDAAGLRHHHAYLTGNERVSCVFCIMGSIGDLLNGARQEEHLALYRELVDLEQQSLFAFQGSRWLMDIYPEGLTDLQRSLVTETKVKAGELKLIESQIPEDLKFAKGVPQRMITEDEAELMATVRRQVFALYGVDQAPYTDAMSIADRYEELLLAAGVDLSTLPVGIITPRQQPLFV